jgi:hypothetical protein
MTQKCYWIRPVRVWTRIESIDSKIMNDSMPILMDYFSRMTLIQPKAIIGGEK